MSNVHCILKNNHLLWLDFLYTFSFRDTRCIRDLEHYNKFWMIRFTTEISIFFYKFHYLHLFVVNLSLKLVGGKRIKRYTWFSTRRTKLSERRFRKFTTKTYGCPLYICFAKLDDLECIWDLSKKSPNNIFWTGDLYPVRTITRRISFTGSNINPICFINVK